MTIDYARFRDPISVTEDDVYEYVVATAFQDGVDDDAEGRGADDRLRIVPHDDGTVARVLHQAWCAPSEVTVARRADARRKVVLRLMTTARIIFNHRYRRAGSPTVTHDQS